MAQQYVLVYDPGATKTKGVLIKYERGGQIRPEIDSTYSQKSNTVDRNGILCETAPEFMKDLLGQIPPEKRRGIVAIATISHGASEIPIDESGKPVFGGAVFYNQRIFDKHHQKFLDIFGGTDQLFLKTGSAEYGVGINAAQQLFYFQQEHPADFDRVTTLLPLSHYMAFQLTGERATCHTHTRNHAYMENIVQAGQGWQWSDVVYDMGIHGLFPAFRRPFDVNGVVKKEIREEYGLPDKCIVVATGHDTSVVPILAPNYANTGTWICNVATGVPVKLVPEMQQVGLVVNADYLEQNLRTIMGRWGQNREEHRKQFGVCPEDVAFESFGKITAFVRNAFTEGVGVYNPAMAAKLPDSLRGLPVEFVHSMSLTMAAPETLTSILTSDDQVPMTSTLSGLLQNGYRAKPLVIGGNFVAPLEDGSLGAFAEIMSRLYPGTLEMFTFREPTSYAAFIMAICALEGVDPRNLGDRVQTPKRDITFNRDRSEAIETLVKWEKAQQG